MELIFKPETHTYQTIGDPTKQWTSVTRLIGLFKEPFDKELQAIKSSKNKKSKWYKMPPKKIIEYWDAEGARSIMLGTWYHDQREKEILMCDTIQREQLDLPVIKSVTQEDGIKVSPNQVLEPGIYPEHFMYLNSAGVCGQGDRIEVIRDSTGFDFVDIYDYKTGKKIDVQGYTNWEGITKKMAHPLQHLDDCNLIHYALQLSIYMYIILKHNPKLIPRKLIIHHVTFELDGHDEFGFPIAATDLEGNPIVKEVIPYTVPYLKREVASLLHYIVQNPKLLKL